MPLDGYLKELREKIGPMRVWVPGVRAMIFDDAGRVLLQRRTDTGDWALPAGAVELGETVWQALLREVEEETAIVIEAATPMCLHCGPEQWFAYPNGDEVQSFALTFLVSDWHGTPTPDGHEGLELAFFPVDDLPEPFAYLHLPTIDVYRRYDGQFLLA